MKRNCVQNHSIQNFPDDVHGLPRRKFVKQLLGGAAAFAVSSGVSIGGNRLSLEALKDTTSRITSGDYNQERYWNLVKEHFLIRKGLVMLNAANLCPSPYPVQQRVFDLTRDLDSDPSSINRRKFSGLREESRKALAQYLGASPDEIAITRNTSEGNNIVIGGLTFKQGDEVVIWDENHPTANIAWDVRGERYGFSVKRIKVPTRFKSDEELIEPFQNAITPRTRVLCFSHVSNVSGVALPVKKICRMAQERGVLTHVDGAQTFGSHVVDLHDLSCDFYTGSSHKWFVGPKEVGILYVKKEKISELWPSIVGVGYSSAKDKGARKFETLGQRDDSRIAAMATTVEFHNTIGKERVEARIRSLTLTLKHKIQSEVPDVEFRTPLEPKFSGGVVIFSIPQIDLSIALNTFYQKYNIGCAVFGGDLGGIRFCPHIYNTMAEIDEAVYAVLDLIRSKRVRKKPIMH